MAGDVTVVLLHGAGTGAWVWDRVMSNLSLPSLALDVPGRVHGVTPNSCSTALVAKLDRKGTDSVILVLHSLSGALAPDLAFQLGTRLQGIVYVGAVIPPEGGSFVDAFPFAQRLLLRLLFAFNKNGLKPSSAMIHRQLCNDLTSQDTDLVISRYAEEMPGLYLSRTGNPAPRIGTTYIKLSKDQTCPPPQQESMIRRLDNPRIREVNAGHLAMLSAPADLAAIIEEEAKTFLGA
jgi:pimeloyl-ACP methyl ester carboxylesterase